MPAFRPYRFESVLRLLPLALLGLVLALPASAEQDDADDAVIDTILVTLTRVPQPEQQVIAPVHVVGREDIELRQAGSLADLIDTIPGLTPTQGPRPEALLPSIRGLGEGRVVMRLDGARQNMAIRHRAQTLIDPVLLERVEILRGPASSLYGSGATGGVMLFETLDAEGFLEPGREFGGRIGLGYQSNNNAGSGTATLAGHRGDFGLITSLSHRQSDDYSDGDGNTLQFTESEITSGLLKGTWQPHPDHALSLTYLGFIDDSPSLTTADRPAGEIIDRSTRQQSTSFRYKLDPANDRIMLDAVAYWSKLIFDERPVSPGQARAENSLSTVGLDLANTSRFATGTIDHTLTLGVELYRDIQRGLRDGAPAPQFRGSRRETVGVFAQNRAELTERLDLVLGLRHDDIDSQADETDLATISSSKTSFQAGLLFDLSDHWAVTASFNEAFRAPALRELYIGGQHFPGNQYVPNPDLKPESARNHELGLRFEQRGVMAADDRLRARLAVFRNDIDDFIEQRVRGGDAPEPLTDTTRFDNVGKARIEGIELELLWRIGDYRTDLFASRLRGDDRELGIPLESIPGDRFGLRIERMFNGLLIGGQVIHTAAQNRVLGSMHGAQPTPSYTLLDAYLVWEVSDDWRVLARVDNLTDQTYRSHLTLINQPGRNARLGLAYRF